jgi:hypothetical protein
VVRDHWLLMMLPAVMPAVIASVAVPGVRAKLGGSSPAT